MEKYLTASEAAAELGVTRRRVNALIAAGRLPADWMGPIRVIRAADLALVRDRKSGRPAKKNGSLSKTRRKSIPGKE